MDLPTCPTCGQSVLDDDVENCPFCGASMTGKPSTTPRKPPPQPAASPQSTGAPKEAEPQASRASSAADEDDPFAVDTSAAKKAIRSSPKRTKGRSYKVVCPMCETVGYVPRKAAGKEVRCANPECLVPVFTAAELPQKEEPVRLKPVRRPLTSMQKFVITSVAVVAAALVCIYFALFGGGEAVQPDGDSPIPDSHADGPPENGDQTTNGDEKAAKTENGEKVDPHPPRHAPPQGPSLTEIRQLALKLMVESSRETSGNRSKPYCRRMTAEAFAHTGDLQEARNQLTRLERLRLDVPFYKVIPLVAIAWKELGAGRDNAAEQTLEEAWKAAQRLPQFGRVRLDSATALAAALVAVARHEDAGSLVGQYHDEGPLGQLSAHLQAVCDSRRFDLETALSDAPLEAWKNPQSVAVVRRLTAHGYWEPALEWAEGRTDVEERTDCLVAWAEQLAGTRQPNQSDRFSAAAQKLSPAGKARLLARVAGRQLAGGDKTAAEESLSKAQATLASIAVPSPVILPGMKELYRLALPPNTVANRTAAVAAAEIARVESLLGRTEAAWSSLTLAIRFPRGMAPSPVAIQRRLGEIEKLGAAAIRSRLKTALGLQSDDEARMALNQYRKQCKLFRDAADARFRLQSSLLSRAAEWNLCREIWDEIRTRSQQANPDQQEPFFATAVPWILADRCRDSGDRQTANAIQTTLQQADWKPDRQRQLMQETARLVAAGNFQSAAVKLQTANVDKTWRAEWAMRLACRLVKSDSFPSAFKFVRSLNDRILREDSFGLIAALAASKGQSAAVWTILKESELSPTEKIAIAHGLILGITGGDSSQLAN